MHSALSNGDRLIEGVAADARTTTNMPLVSRLGLAIWRVDATVSLLNGGVSTLPPGEQCRCLVFYSWVARIVLHSEYTGSSERSGNKDSK